MTSILITFFDINYWKMSLRFTAFDVLRLWGTLKINLLYLMCLKLHLKNALFNHKVNFNHVNLSIIFSDYQDDFATLEEEDDAITLVTENFCDTNDPCIIVQSSIFDKTTPSTPKKAILTSKNLVTPLPASEKWSKASNSKVASSHPSCSTVVSVITAFNSAFNVDYYASLRPKRRSHHAPTYAKTYPTIKNSSPS